MEDLHPEFKKLYEDGNDLKAKILKHLLEWPTEQKESRAPDGDVVHYSQDIELPKTSGQHKKKVQELVDETRKWFNIIKAEVLPLVVFDTQYLYYILRKVEAAISKRQYVRPYPSTGSQTVHVSSNLPSFFRSSGKADIDIRTSLKLDFSLLNRTRQ